MTRCVYDFAQGSGSMKARLGGKGAALAEMTRLGLPVPPGFTITTDACAYYHRQRAIPESVVDEVRVRLGHLERVTGRRLGDPNDPLLVSVRSGAPISMPGMMDTVLNIGLSDASVHGLGRATGDERFAWDSYRRLLHMFAGTVLGIEPLLLDRAAAAIEHPQSPRGVEEAVARLRMTMAAAGRMLPQDPIEQLLAAIQAVFRSWDNARAESYRKRHNLPQGQGTAVTVQAMVFGNRGRDSGTGVAFTRNPLTGAKQPFGDFLPNAQGEDVVAGVADTLPLADMSSLHPGAWAELLRYMAILEGHFADMCDIEFTVEQGRLWLLQCRVGTRSAEAEWVIASDMIDDGLITIEQALCERLSPARLDELLRPAIQVDAKTAAVPLTRGVAASPGAAVGRVVFHPEHACARMNEPIILVRPETTPQDYAAMVASKGILTATGGSNSHAAVVARGEGIPAVCGAKALQIDADRFSMTVGDATVRQWDWLTIDGTDGSVYAGRLPTEPPILEAAVRGDPQARRSPLWRAYERFMDAVRSAEP